LVLGEYCAWPEGLVWAAAAAAAAATAATDPVRGGMGAGVEGVDEGAELGGVGRAVGMLVMAAVVDAETSLTSRVF
jgi:hypothetical protein